MTITAVEKAIFAPLGQGPLALAPQAYGASFDVVALPAQPEALAAPELTPEQMIRCVPVRGPLMHHADPKFLSYEVVAMIVGWHISSGARVIVLDIDSPGGLVAGAFETAKAIRKMCRDAGVRLVGYVDGQCSSAAYALASQCDEIVAPEASTIGSIGVLDVLSDTTRKAQLEGVRSVLITSGARKSDGNPLVEITAEAVAAKQEHVDDLADVFFSLVASTRAITADQVKALEAATFSGARALSKGLIDRVLDFSSLKKDLVASVTPRNDQEAKPADAGAASSKGPAPMASAARKALQAIVDGKDYSDDDKKDARAALKAMGDEDKPADDKKDDKKDAKAEDKPADDKKDDKPADDKKDAKAEDGDKKDEKKDAEEAKARAAANPTLAALTEHQALKGAAPGDEAERTRLLATRPDFTPALALALASEPLGVVRHYVRTMPKGQSPMAASLAASRGGAAAITPAAKPSASAPVAGAGEEETPEQAEVTARMGLNAGKPRAFMNASGDEQIFSIAGHSAR